MNQGIDGAAGATGSVCWKARGKVDFGTRSQSKSRFSVSSTSWYHRFCLSTDMLTMPVCKNLHFAANLQATP